MLLGFNLHTKNGTKCRVVFKNLIGGDRNSSGTNYTEMNLLDLGFEAIHESERKGIDEGRCMYCSKVNHRQNSKNENRGENIRVSVKAR